MRKERRSSRLGERASRSSTMEYRCTACPVVGGVSWSMTRTGYTSSLASRLHATAGLRPTCSACCRSRWLGRHSGPAPVLTVAGDDGRTGLLATHAHWHAGQLRARCQRHAAAGGAVGGEPWLSTTAPLRQQRRSRRRAHRRTLSGLPAGLIVVVCAVVCLGGAVFEPGLGHGGGHDTERGVLLRKVDRHCHSLQLRVQPQSAVMVDGQREHVLPGAGFRSVWPIGRFPIVRAALPRWARLIVRPATLRDSEC